MPRTVAKKETAQVSFEPVVEQKVAKEETPAEKVETVKVETAEKEKLYSIKLRVNHSCYIGGTMYHFQKGGIYRVTSDVKRILSTAGLLTNL